MSKHIEPSPGKPVEPLTPRPVLFKVLLALFLLWLGLIWVMWLTTIRR